MILSHGHTGFTIMIPKVNDFSLISPKSPDILVVDDQKIQRMVLQSCLEQRGFEVRVSSTAVEALIAINHQVPDLILLNVPAPASSEMRLIKQLRNLEKTTDTPIVMVSSHDDSDLIVLGLENGASDFVAKPFDPSELVARVEMHLRTVEKIKRLENHNKMLSRLIHIDELTGLHNHRYFFRTLETEMNRSIRYGRPMSLVMLDIEFFKQINDAHGHLIGDSLLREFAHRLQKNVRRNDIVCRYGGDQFCVILPETDADATYGSVHRLLDSLRKPYVLHDREIGISIHYGVATLNDKEFQTPDEMITCADNALFRARGGSQTPESIVLGLDMSELDGLERLVN